MDSNVVEQLSDAEPAGGEQQPAGSDGCLQAGWTSGSRLATLAVTGLLWAALTAGPVGLALAVVQAGGPARPAAAAPVVDRSGEQAAVGEFAQRLVVVWLQSRRGQEGALAPLVQGGSRDGVQLPDVPWRAEQPATAGLRHVAGEAWSVTVGVTVSPLAAPAGAGVRRYFQVAVTYRAGAMVAPMLPAPVAAPPAAAAEALGYRYPVAPGGAVSTAVTGFLAALLTGSGDVTRYVSPGSVIPAVTPAPYRAVTVGEVLADRDVPGSALPATGGDRVRVLVTAAAGPSARQQLSVQYALTLTARAGRWEVTALDPTPELASSAGGPPPAGSTPGVQSSN